MLVKVIDQVPDGDLRETLWKLYEDSFAELRSLAVQRHLMYRSEFDEVMDDPRISKYLALEDNGTPVGIATYTNDLEAVPLIAPEYFERHWRFFETSEPGLAHPIDPLLGAELAARGVGNGTPVSWQLPTRLETVVLSTFRPALSNWAL